jgi:hypothetical protein
MSRARRLLLVALVPAAVVPAAAAAQGGSVGPVVPPSDPGPSSFGPQPMSWALVGTADAGRSLIVRQPGYGGCQTAPTASVVERASSIEVAVTTTVPAPGSEVACTAIAHVPSDLTVRLSAKVAGRRIVGAMRSPSTPFSSVPFQVGPGPARLVVPDVRGLRALDARRALCAAGFASRTAGRSPAGAAVRGTDPRAGTRRARPSSDVVERRTAAGACAGTAWAGVRRVAVLTAPK